MRWYHAAILAAGFVAGCVILAAAHLLVNRFDYHPLPDGEPGYRYDRWTSRVEHFDTKDQKWYYREPTTR